VDAPLVVESTPLFLRGHDILAAALDQLLSPAPGGGAPSLSAATEVVVCGGSAGGLSVFLHLDYVAGRVRAANPRAAVAGVANDGFFIDGASIWGGRHFLTEVFQRVVAMGNVTHPAQVNGACMQARAPPLQWQCFMAEYTLPYLATRVFIFNSFEDQWQAESMLSPNTSSINAPGGVVQWAPFAPCTHAPTSGCNATQYAQWHGWRRTLLGVRAQVGAPGLPQYVVDNRQASHEWSPWMWAAGSYAEPLQSDEQTTSWTAVVTICADLWPSTVGRTNGMSVATTLSELKTHATHKTA
jgi:hypothetical protein